MVKDEYEGDNTVSPALSWDMIKLKVREKSLSYAANKKKNSNRRETEIEQRIASLEKELDSSPKTNLQKNADITKQLNGLRSELEKIIESRTKGAILRSKIKWHNEGEKNTKYFLSLEKRHYKQGTISQLKVNDKDFATSDQRILSECESFYTNLYTSKVTSPSSIATSEFFVRENNTFLNEEEKTSCEGPLTEKECLAALKSMEPEKTPGSDGLPADFYKIFWIDIADILCEALNYGYDTGQLSITQKRGIIKLIPKKETEPFYIKNWRPITLLNCDYKIAAKSLANRLKNVLPNLISSDQTGFMKNRFIGENVLLIENVIRYAKEKNITGLLLFLDFEKAFDTIEWPFIFRTLEFFGFGKTFVSWIKCFYSDIESCVINNGWGSNFFKIKRGVRQGCPLSPYLFVLTVEVLAKEIRGNKNIKGILIKSKEIKISQYADDTTLILDGSKKSLTSALTAIDNFGKVSGLKLNSKKTEALWIGANSGKDINLLPERNLKWQKNKVRSLGTWLSTDPEATVLLNYTEKLEKVRNILSNWKYRRLTLLGKITVLKSLVASQLVYIMTPLCFSEKIIHELNTLFYSFVWNGKGDKIKRNVMINDYAEGGLRMIDIQSFSKALKATWIRKYLDTTNQGKWKLFFDLELERFGCSLPFTGNLNTKDTEKIFKNSGKFIKEILLLWSEINFEGYITSKSQFLEQSIWHNSLIRIDEQPLFLKVWHDHGIDKVKHFKDDENNYLTLQDFQSKFNIVVQPLAYIGIVSALKSLWNSCRRNFITIISNKN